MITIDGSVISIDKGDSGFIRFIFSDKRHNVDLSDKQFRLIIKQHKEDSDSSAILDTTNNVANIDDSFILFPIAATVSDNAPGTYFWALRMLDTGSVNTLKEGVFLITQGTYYGINS